MPRKDSPGIFVRAVAVLLLIVGIAMALPGIYLLTLGGSAYYVVAGIVMAISGALMWRGGRSGAWLYLLLLLGTCIWAVWESGWDGWALLPRLNVLVAGGLLVLLAAWRPLGWRVIGAAAIVAIVGVAGTMLFLPRTHGKSGGKIAALAPAAADADWRAIGRTTAADRFSPLTQINADNVSGLEVAWKVNLGMPPEHMVGAIQATPLKVNDTLYICNMHNEVLAIDAETGGVKWRFDPEIDTHGVIMTTCRGVTYVEAPPQPDAPDGSCVGRVVLLTHDARMIALDARSGRKCAGFGTGGEVDLAAGMGELAYGYLYMTSPALLVRDVLVVGSSVLDGQEINEPSGVIRGFDAITGEFRWAWDMGRPGETGMPGEGQIFTPGTPNSWAPATGDNELGLAFMPLGNATPDYVSGHRTPEMNAYNASLVALDVETGQLRWHYQTTHLDVWDYDNASPPTLFDMPTAGGVRKAVVQPTKRGEFFILDRLTGEPLVETVERPVPQGAVAGETLSPTQPYPVGMPSFRGPDLNEKRMWGVTPFDHMWCRIRFKQARYEGDFTPISLQPTIVYPGYLGGSNWSGVSVDTDRNLLVVNVNYFPMYNQMVPRAEADPGVYRPYRAGVAALDIAHWPQDGTPYATKTGPFISPIGVPCNQPPYSEIAAIDLATQTVKWRQPLGTARDSGVGGLKFMLPLRMGVPGLGGTLVTKSGLVFIGATQERSFRAFDVNTGKLLWHDRLPAGGHANPMSYFSEASSRQFVVIPASGHPQMNNQINGRGADYLIAYALPKKD